MVKAKWLIERLKTKLTSFVSRITQAEELEEKGRELLRQAADIRKAVTEEREQFETLLGPLSSDQAHNRQKEEVEASPASPETLARAESPEKVKPPRLDALAYRTAVEKSLAHFRNAKSGFTYSQLGDYLRRQKLLRRAYDREERLAAFLASEVRGRRLRVVRAEGEMNRYFVVSNASPSKTVVRAEHEGLEPGTLAANVLRAAEYLEKAGSAITGKAVKSALSTLRLLPDGSGRKRKEFGPAVAYLQRRGFLIMAVRGGKMALQISEKGRKALRSLAGAAPPSTGRSK